VIRSHPVTAIHRCPRHRSRCQPALNETESQPDAPFGAGSAFTGVCTSPSSLVARTLSWWSPAGTSSVASHCTQVSFDDARPRFAGCQAPPSSCTSTALIPVFCCQALPPTRTVPAPTSSPSPGTSIRYASFTGPCSDQPRDVQYAVNESKVVTSISRTHFVADT
jgi:hypothetical protein